MQIDELVSGYWRANNATLMVCSPELSRLQGELVRIGDVLSKDKTVRIVFHDRIAGFHFDEFKVEADPKNQSRLPMVALSQIFSEQPNFGDALMKYAPYDPDTGQVVDMSLRAQQDIIFVLKGWEDVVAPVLTGLMPDQNVITALRNIIHGNLCAGQYDDNGNCVRGRRMLVFLSAAANAPLSFPELKPFHIPLPEPDEFTDMVKIQLESDKTVKRDFGAGDAEVKTVTTSLAGLTMHGGEEALAFARSVVGGFRLPDLLAPIEATKEQMINAVPGLNYLHHPEGDFFPGYEALSEFIDDATGSSEEYCRQHKLPRLKGIFLAGPQGCGKTEIGKRIASRLKRPLVLWSIGESQGGLVGQSEAQARQAIATIDAMRALAILDDFDKAGAGVVRQGSSGDGGVMSRIINMILTYMPSSKAVWVFTANRVQNVPPELYRMGRVDGCFQVEFPNSLTRLRILAYQFKRYGFPFPEEGTPERALVEVLVSDDFTDKWSGAELEDLVVKAGRRAGRTGTHELDLEWMSNRAKTTTPLAAQTAAAADITQIQEMCKGFDKLGNILEAPKVKSRSTRQVVHGRSSSSTGSNV